jgi:redox-sensitive bicupin YhaK (pirin superfamily)
MKGYREIKDVFKAKPTMEGAGVRLKRVFGYYEVPLFDPFLLLDDFHSDNPDDYIAGFPWHPHRGIETVTYMIHGFVKHEDSMGNSGTIGAGDIQWMTAGSGIIHSEMPGQDEGLLHGFQLWVNLPSVQKMISPRYQEFSADKLPQAQTDRGVSVKVISGRFGNIQGPVRDIVVDPTYLDIAVPKNSDLLYDVEAAYTCLAYVFKGGVHFCSKKEESIGPESVVLFDRGDKVSVLSGDEGCRFLLISGKPLQEPVAWRGPIVMNTEEELRQAFADYNNGTFIKSSA